MDTKALKDWLESIDPEMISNVKKLYPEINRLKYYCVQTGKIERIGAGEKYKVLQQCDQLLKLKKLLAELKIGGVTFYDK
jgi:hypothetical protein